MEEKALVPTTTQEIDFYGDLLTVALVHDMAYVAIKPITDFLGLDWASQRQRVQRDEVMKEESRIVATIGADGKQREMFCLPLEYLPGYLFGISASRVKPEMKDKIIRYQRECFRILWHAFQARAVDIVPQLADTQARVSNLEQDMKAVKVILSEIRGLSTAHRATAKEMVDQISRASGVRHQTIWTDLNKAFHVPAYGDIQDEKWPDVQKYLQKRLDTARQDKGIQGSLFDE